MAHTVDEVLTKKTFITSAIRDLCLPAAPTLSAFDGFPPNAPIACHTLSVGIYVLFVFVEPHLTPQNVLLAGIN